MFVGEGPGEQEDLLARPFVGRSGELLDEVLAYNGLTRDDVYIANIIKCRPPENRNPTQMEMGACSAYLYKQIMAIEPKCIIALGRVAAGHLLKRDVKITQERGRRLRCFDFPHISLVPALHPSYILRNGGKDKDKLIYDVGYGLDLALIGSTPAQIDKEVDQMWMEQNQEDFEKRER
jgi:DNA polymerase